jgi:hypothetical protein
VEFQIMVMVAMESEDGQGLFRSLELVSYETICTTAVGFQRQPDVGPELSFRAKAMRRLD